MKRLITAYHFAAEKHKNQRRKDATKSPYINHPIQVAQLLDLAGVSDEDTIIAGILHDTVEDTGTTLKELVDCFGSNVASIVAECTDDKSLPKVKRKQLQIIDAGHHSIPAKLVKLADKLSNLSDIKENPPAAWSQEQIRGYVVWAYAVCQEMTGTNLVLESHLHKLFMSFGIIELSQNERNALLEKYYQSMADSK